MKKKYLVAILFFALPAFALPVKAEDCDSVPSCEELGYTMTVSECEGKSTLRCPLEPSNDNAVYCGGNEDSSQ